MLKGLRSLKNKVISHAIQEIIKIQSAVDARNFEKCSLLTVAYLDYSYNFVIKQLSSWTLVYNKLSKHLGAVVTKLLTNSEILSYTRYLLRRRKRIVFLWSLSKFALKWSKTNYSVLSLLCRPTSKFSNWKCVEKINMCISNKFFKEIFSKHFM